MNEYLEYITVFKNFLREAFQNDTMYYVVVPIVITLQILQNWPEWKKRLVRKKP